MEPLLKKLADHCIDTGESYTRIARSNGIGVGRLLKAINEMKDSVDHKVTIQDEISNLFEENALDLSRYSNKPNIDDTICVFFQDGTFIEVSFGKIVKTIKMKGDIL